MGPLADEAPDVVERVREYSKQVFGNRDRMEVALAIAQSEEDVVNATDLSWQLQIATNRVRAQLLAFAEVGLLQPAPDRIAGKRAFLRLDSPFWDLCEALMESWVRP